MKKRSGMIKNIIMVVASALTLVAVSFAWFTTNFTMNLKGNEFTVSGETLKIDFYQAYENNKYQPLVGDINLEKFVPGEFNKYKFEITTKTADKLKMSFSIDDIPADIPQELADSVCIKYSVYKLKKQVSATTGAVSYINSTLITQSEDYISLSELDEGKIIPSLSLANYQTKTSEKFAIYYEIGLADDAPAVIGGMESGLGNINISAQRIG